MRSGMYDTTRCGIGCEAPVLFWKEMASKQPSSSARRPTTLTAEGGLTMGAVLARD